MYTLVDRSVNHMSPKRASELSKYRITEYSLQRAVNSKARFPRPSVVDEIIASRARSDRYDWRHGTNVISRFSIFLLSCYIRGIKLTWKADLIFIALLIIISRNIYYADWIRKRVKNIIIMQIIMAIFLFLFFIAAFIISIFYCRTKINERRDW